MVPLDFLLVRALDAYEFERLAVPRAADNDFVLVNLFREPIGAAMPPDAINTLITAAGRRAGLHRRCGRTSCDMRLPATSPMRAAVWTRSPTCWGMHRCWSSQVYLHPDPGRLRAAIDGVRSPRADAAVPR